ncbi:hypothetical protein ACJMK2_035688 [Sinanodonta woodiana]|uniref:Snake toxin/toxin-like domain-containing protein n=1 Tax=Sinanodonta woodiana TaxID=1069815 RepID=A0ABD3WX20_SINWO
MYPTMKPSCAFSIVLLFVTGLNISLVASQTNSTTNVTQAAAVNTAAPGAASTGQTSTAGKYECISYSCNEKGCLTNASNPQNCTGTFCMMVLRYNQTSYNISASCASNCADKDESEGGLTVFTRCCQDTKCNKDDKKIVALTAKTSGSTSIQARLWILSIMLFISAFEIIL